MDFHKVNFEQLSSEYSDPRSLQYKKLRIVDSYIPKGELLLDVGMGTGELINLQKQKFEEVFGIDADPDSVHTCRERFQGNSSINILHGSMHDLAALCGDTRFDVITALDILEHLNRSDCEGALCSCYNMLKDGGMFVFSGPGIFEKIRICLGLSPTHLHSHSPSGWRKIIENAGFTIVSIETVEFPIFHSDYLRKKVRILGKCCIIVARK